MEARACWVVWQSIFGFAREVLILITNTGKSAYRMLAVALILNHWGLSPMDADISVSAGPPPFAK
jgi:hypothetical protein